MAFEDHQTKIPVESFPSEELLHNLGAVRHGQVQHGDIYLKVADALVCLRYDNGGITYSRTTTRLGVGKSTRQRFVETREITVGEADELKRFHGERVRVNKVRTIWRLGEVTIRFDEVDHLGVFIELAADSERAIEEVVAILGLVEEDAETKSYHDLMVEKNLPRHLVLLIRFGNLITELTFGVASGVMTTLGLLIAVQVSGAGRYAVVAAIVGIAFSDSGGDGGSVIIAKRAERGTTLSAAIRSGLFTVVAKACVPMMIVVPVLFLPALYGTVGAIALGVAILLLLSVQQAVLTERPIVASLRENFSVAGFVVVLGLLGGLIAGQLETMIS